MSQLDIKNKVDISGIDDLSPPDEIKNESADTLHEMCSGNYTPNMYSGSSDNYLTLLGWHQAGYWIVDWSAPSEYDASDITRIDGDYYWVKVEGKMTAVHFDEIEDFEKNKDKYEEVVGCVMAPADLVGSDDCIIDEDEFNYLIRENSKEKTILELRGIPKSWQIDQVLTLVYEILNSEISFRDFDEISSELFAIIQKGVGSKTSTGN